MQSLISYLGVMQEIIIPCLSHNSIWSWCKVSFRCRQHDAKSSLLCFTLATKHWRCLVSSGNKNNLVMCRKKCDVLIWCLSQKSRTKVHKITGDVCFQAGRKLLSPGWKSCICFPPCRPRPLSLSAFHFFLQYAQIVICSNRWKLMVLQCRFIIRNCIFPCNRGLTYASGYKELWPNIKCWQCFSRAGNERDCVTMEPELLEI